MNEPAAYEEPAYVMVNALAPLLTAIALCMGPAISRSVLPSKLMSTMVSASAAPVKLPQAVQEEAPEPEAGAASSHRVALLGATTGTKASCGSALEPTKKPAEVEGKRRAAGRQGATDERNAT